jgi:hypothetical protein
LQTQKGGDKNRNVKSMEDVVETGFGDSYLSGRLTELIAVLKAVQEEWGRFLIVSRRLFPLVLVFWVSF